MAGGYAKACYEADRAIIQKKVESIKKTVEPKRLCRFCFMLCTAFLPFLYPQPIDKAVNIICQKRDKAYDYRHIGKIAQCRQHP